MRKIIMGLFVVLVVVIFPVSAVFDIYPLNNLGTLKAGQNVTFTQSCSDVCAGHGMTKYSSDNTKLVLYPNTYYPTNKSTSTTADGIWQTAEYPKNYLYTVPAMTANNNNTGMFWSFMCTCSNWYGTLGDYYYFSNQSYVPVPLEVNFTGYPLDGYNPLDVMFSIQNVSEVNATGAQFTFGDGQIGNTTTSSINHTYLNPGIYSVSMNYFNTSGYPFTISKNNYVLASTPTGMIVYLDIKDALSPNPFIQDSTGSIQNRTTLIWRNVTTSSGKMYFSTTDPGYLYPLSQNQSIQLCANKSGYRETCDTFNIPYNGYLKQLFLMPTNVVNATGTGMVVASAIHNTNGLPISGISVVMDTGQMGITNSAGATTLYNVTAGTRYATATDTDGVYLPTKYAFNLTAGETKLIVIQMLRPGETPVTTPVSPTPTPSGTYDPNDPNSPVYGNYTTSQINQEGGAGILGMLMQLIQLWPLILVGVLMKFLKSTFS